MIKQRFLCDLVMDFLELSNFVSSFELEKLDFNLVLIHWISIPDLLADEPCKANEIEKRKANNAMNNILSMLTHYSELTGRLVCAKRCNLSGMGPLGASLNISLGRIKQSFVLWVLQIPFLFGRRYNFASHRLLKCILSVSFAEQIHT